MAQNRGTFGGAAENDDRSLPLKILEICSRSFCASDNCTVDIVNRDIFANEPSQGYKLPVGVRL